MTRSRPPDTPLEGPFANPSAALGDIGQVIAASPEWQTVKDAMVEAFNLHGDPKRVMEAGIAKLREVGLDGETMLGSIPPQYRKLMSDDDLADAAAALDAYMIGSAANDIVTGSPLPLPSMAGGQVSVEQIDHDGIVMPVVHAYVTPMGDPEDIAARFVAACYQNFDPETFAKREMGGRDAEWWRRHRQGETYRQIALSDERSGIPPEARAYPQHYKPEVTRGTDRVRRAVIRFHKRWTQKVDSVSKEMT